MVALRQHFKIYAFYIIHTQIPYLDVPVYLNRYSVNHVQYLMQHFHCKLWHSSTQPNSYVLVIHWQKWWIILFLVPPMPSVHWIRYQKGNVKDCRALIGQRKLSTVQYRESRQHLQLLNGEANINSNCFIDLPQIFQKWQPTKQLINLLILGFSEHCVEDYFIAVSCAIPTMISK